MDYTTEKKLRPLYEALDEGQNKIALQHCAKLLKKSPDWPLVKALKALVLVRTGKEEESLELCEQVKRVIPTDEPTLQAVTMALKELGQHSVIVELYENAANQQPKNEEFANHWFMAMVRNNDFKGQQAAAVKLHRLFKHNKYLFWAIMSLALQSTSLAYVLAERMMAKAREEGRLQEVEHMRLYLLILMDQKKNSEALQLLEDDAPLTQKALRDPEIRQIKSELFRDNQQWQQTLEMSQAALESEADDWFHWLAYFEAMDALSEEKVVREAEALVARSQRTVLDSKVLKRGPFLAELELDDRLRKVGQRSKEDVLNHALAYFERFGSKNCAFEDLYSYVSFLEPERAKTWIEKVKATIHEADNKAAKIKNVHKQVNVRKLERFLGLHAATNIQEAVELVDALWAQYLDALPLGEGLKKTEMQYGDEFAILASHLLLDLYHQQKECSYLIQAISLLESALKKSIHNFQIKLILVRMYTMLGVYKRPFEIYRTMEIKQIQFDTMIHYFTDRFASLGCIDELEDILHESLLIYKSNEVETPEMLVKAYQYGTFSKIQEFIEFRRRLDTSLQHAITQIEIARLDYLHSSFQTKYAVQFFQEIDTNQFTVTDKDYSDNRDFRVFLNYNGQDRPTAEELCKPVQTTSSSSEWVQIMSIILHILSVVCETKKSGRDLNQLSDKLKALLEREEVRKQLSESEFWLARYVSDLTQALILMKTSKDATGELKNATGILENHVSKIDAFLEKNISWNVFHQISTSLEAFNYGSVLIEMMNRTLGLNSKDAKRKAVEKAKSDPQMAAFVQLQESSKKSLQETQTIARSGKDLFRAQLQRKLCKDVLESDYVVRYLKEQPSLVHDYVKLMIQSWSLSSTRLSEEIDRRVQKL
ncbi:MAG: N-acetyltransferase B complex non catalytic subunit-domain-containing protein [Benjaminiella poitrasii]|nr:MAG: N-acetyltransferase B complex non catalytic subunit-domain-containing protein [Benjaminiella poitrasii]